MTTCRYCGRPSSSKQAGICRLHMHLYQDPWFGRVKGITDAAKELGWKFSMGDTVVKVYMPNAVIEWRGVRYEFQDTEIIFYRKNGWFNVRSGYDKGGQRHPHAGGSVGELCLGNGRSLIAYPYKHGDYIGTLVQAYECACSYNPRDRINPLGQIRCGRCHYFFDIEEMWYCENCETYLCQGCQGYFPHSLTRRSRPLKRDGCRLCHLSCQACGKVVAEKRTSENRRKYLNLCPSCSRYVCDSCIRTCKGCGIGMCIRCRDVCDVCKKSICSLCYAMVRYRGRVLHTCRECRDDIMQQELDLRKKEMIARRPKFRELSAAFERQLAEGVNIITVPLPETIAEIAEPILSNQINIPVLTVSVQSVFDQMREAMAESSAALQRIQEILNEEEINYELPEPIPTPETLVDVVE